MKDLFKDVAMTKNNPKYLNATSRIYPLYKKEQDVRSDFERDCNRIIFSNAYKRLKHKTQVFFSPQNDHICTRIEHVNLVETISYTIANYLGLNTELTRAIAISHDLGHSPFGHRGEKILSDIAKREINNTFWHERNGIDLVDYFELLEDYEGNKRNLDLTYAVRDGILSHCGEIDETSLKPREEFINLDTYLIPNQFSPYTWEACVVKLVDKIAYLGRDIEDAITLRILDENLEELYSLLNYGKNEKINNTILINHLIYDLFENSSPEKGLSFSESTFEYMKKIKEFNYKYIYSSHKVMYSNQYFELVLNGIYNILKNNYDGENTLLKLESQRIYYPQLIDSFISWISNYLISEKNIYLKNISIFNLNNKNDFYKAIIYYISGMTDNFAIEVYNEIIGF